MLLKIKTNIEHPIISRKEAIRVGFTFILVVGIAFSGIIGLLLLRNANLVTKNATYRSTNQESHDAIDALYHHVDRTVNGTTWHYVDEGNVTGIVILFLHGLPECWYSWRYILPLINQSYRFIVLDMKGYGRSNPTQTSFDWKVISQEIVDLMSDLGIDQYYVVGHDWGSIIGNMLIIDYPDHILGFVRMEAPIRTETIDMTNNPQFILFQSARLGTIFLQDAEWFIETVYESRMLKPLTSDDKMYLTFEFSRPGVAEAIPKYFSTQNLQYIPDLFGRLCNQIWPFPILLLQADQDPAQPLSYFTDLEIYCPHLQLKWITNASHFTNFDQPEQVATAINMFLQEN